MGTPKKRLIFLGGIFLYELLSYKMNKYGNHKKLAAAVIKQLGGIEELEEVARVLDASTGWPGFTYYSDTLPFAHKNNGAIVRLLEEVAESLGEDPYVMICGFGLFRPDGPDTKERQDIHRYLAGTKCIEYTVPNAMAWFALEEIARMHDSAQ
jgi:hypothetical protein